MPTVDITDMWSALRAQIDAHRDGGLGAEPVAHVAAVPVTLLTGFLGAGKSTLLVNLLQNPGGLRIRALVNDVGALPFDPTLTEVSDSVRVELSNGCGCCTTTSDVASALAVLARRGDCDLIVLEASGAADPATLAQVVHADRALRLDRIVTVVDGGTLLGAPGVHDTTLDRQLSVADCVVVSGCDRLTQEESESALGEAARRAPGRTVTASGVGHTASLVLVPGSPRGTHLPVGATESQHAELCVTTLRVTRDVTRVMLVAALERARPGLVRVKGTMTVDGEPVTVQVTPRSIDITAAEQRSTGVTLISLQEGDVEELLRLLS